MKKILFVDDEADLLKVSVLRLKKSGYEVLEAMDGQLALDLARQQNPDLIIVDAYLPLMSGDEVARIIKADEQLKRLPVILISADTATRKEKSDKCGAAGVPSR